MFLPLSSNVKMTGGLTTSGESCEGTSELRHKELSIQIVCSLTEIVTCSAVATEIGVYDFVEWSLGQDSERSFENVIDRLKSTS